MTKITTLIFFVALLIGIDNAHAACAGPVGEGGDIIFNSAEAQMQYCNDTDWVGFPKADKVADTFDFTDLTNQSIAALVTSNIVTITGIDAPTNVTISGDGSPQFRIAGGAWGSTGQITNGQTLQLRLTTGSAGTQSTAIVTVGTSSPVDWNASTTGPDTVPNAFTFSDVTGAALSTLTTSSAITISGINSGSAVSVSGSGSPQISIAGGTWATSGTITNGQTLAVRLTSSPTAGTMLTATVTVGGVSDAWNVTTDPCLGTPTIGQVCGDASIYAGISADGSVKMYTTPADAPSLMSWSSSNADTAMGNCTASQAECSTGEANTATLVGYITGSLTYNAANYCSNLTSHGKTDWYLPAKAELDVLYTNRVAIGSFNLTSTTTFYMSSSEYNNPRYRNRRFDNGSENLTGIQKVDGHRVRCVRK
jgi:hypothetical protein